MGFQSREYTRFCEAKTVLSWKLTDRRAYLEQVEKSRGMAGRREVESELKRWHGQIRKVSQVGGKS